jgi:hypothetical protein
LWNTCWMHEDKRFFCGYPAIGVVSSD